MLEQTEIFVKHLFIYFCLVKNGQFMPRYNVDVTLHWISLMLLFSLCICRKANFTSITQMGSNKRQFSGRTCQGSSLRVTATQSTPSLLRLLLVLNSMLGGLAGEERGSGQRWKPWSKRYYRTCCLLLCFYFERECSGLLNFFNRVLGVFIILFWAWILV